MKNLISLLFLLFIGIQALGQDTFYVKHHNSNIIPVAGCAILLVDFIYEYNGAAPDSVKLFYDGKQFVDNNDWEINGNKYSIARFLDEGVYQTQAKVYRNGNESTLTGNTVTVYKNPEARFEILSDSTQCFENNKICILDNSTADSIKSIYVDIGDGNLYKMSANDTICHSYRQSGEFDITYTVTDYKGCQSSLIKSKLVKVKPEISADFRIKFSGLDCSKRQIIVENKTPIDTSKVKSWHYQIGDIKTISYTKGDLATKWLTDTFNVTKDGLYDIKLVVESIDGCKDSLIMRDAIKVFNPDLNVEMVNTAEYLCVDDTIQFKWNKSETVEDFIFDFGDPASMQNNFEYDNPNPSHKYTSGNSYILNLTTKSKGCDDKDTAICCVNINGPTAIPNLPPPPSFPELNPVYNKYYLAQLNADASLDSSKTRFVYYAKKTGITVDSFKVTQLPENSSFGSVRIGPSGQKIKYPSIADTNAYLGYTYDTVHYRLVKKTWYRDTPIPKEVMYKNARPSFSLEKHQLHDTLKFADPALDSLTITFPNFTSKFRAKNDFGKTGNIWIGYDAFPIDWINGSLNGLNPSYPFASDSLEFFWDFDDPEGENCISTTTNPNPYCNFSREKIPTHIYKANGCYSVKLTATDTITGCSNSAIQPISFEKPVASFDKSKYTEMDWYKQKEILAKTGSLEGLGLFLDGPLCVGNDISPNWHNVHLDGLKPSCNPEALKGNVEILFDAENDCKGKKYIRDANGKIIDSTYTDCSFISGLIIQLIGERWSYTTPGWKTPGVVVFNGHTRDTFFYKNYFYIKDLNTNFILKNSVLDSISQKSLVELKMENWENRALDSLDKVDFEFILFSNTLGQARDEIIQKDSLDILPNGMANLKDSVSHELSPGKYYIRSSSTNQSGCSGAQTQELRVGHLANFRTIQACAGGKTKFIDSVYYWHPGGQTFCELANWFDNTTCIDTNAFFYNPENNTLRRQWQNNSGYTLPKFSERVAWDFTNDGTIDLWDVHAPEHIYQDPGTYECALWSMDSLGQWQKTVKTVEVPGAEINISLADESQRYVCAPDTVTFEIRSNLYYDEIESIEIFGNTYLSRDSFDITVAILNNDLPKNLIKTITKTGCLSSYQDTNLITVLGPKANFNRLTDPRICLGEEMMYASTGDTGRYNWVVNNQLVSNNDTMSFLSQAPGLYSNIQLQVTQTITFPENNGDKECTSTAFINDSSFNKTTFVKSYASNSFKLLQRLDSNKLTFVMQEPDPYFNTFNYFVDNGNHKELFINDSLFTIDFEQAGNYTICTYLNDEECADTFCQSIWVDALSTNETSANKIELYPNPTSHIVNVVIPVETGSYRLFDFTGREVKSGILNKGVNKLVLSELPKGAYILEINSGNEIINFNTIKD